jgi:hypothetical protein
MDSNKLTSFLLGVHFLSAHWDRPHPACFLTMDEADINACFTQKSRHILLKEFAPVQPSPDGDFDLRGLVPAVETAG